MSNSNLGSVAEIVPQFAYDLVGRIIPGTTVIIVGIVAVVGPDKITLDVLGKASELLNAWSVLLFGAAAYVLAFVIEGISLVVWSGWDGMRRSARQQPSNCADAQAVDETLQFDLINYMWPHAGARLTKLYAESTLCRTLVIGWSIAAAVNLVFAVGETWIGIACCGIASLPIGRLLLEGALVAGVFTVLRAERTIAETRTKSRNNLWVLRQQLEEQGE